MLELEPNRLDITAKTGKSVLGGRGEVSFGHGTRNILPIRLGRHGDFGTKSLKNTKTAITRATECPMI